MKNKLAQILALGALALSLGGCALMSTDTTITEYDANGAIVKTTETSESVLTELMQSTKEKTVVAWEDSWAAYIGKSEGLTDGANPISWRMFVGKTNRGWASVLKEQQNLESIAKVVAATKSELNVSFDGVSSSAANNGNATTTAASATTTADTATK